jgi:hypothetical protein
MPIAPLATAAKAVTNFLFGLAFIYATLAIAISFKKQPKNRKYLN